MRLPGVLGGRGGGLDGERNSITIRSFGGGKCLPRNLMGCITLIK